MEKPAQSAEMPKSPTSSRDRSYRTSESEQRNDHIDEGAEMNGEKSNTEDKTQKRKPFEIIICPSQEYMDHLLMDGERVFKQLGAAATAQVFEPKNIDTGGQVMDHVISIFDESTATSGEVMVMPLSSITTSLAPHLKVIAVAASSLWNAPMKVVGPPPSIE